MTSNRIKSVSLDDTQTPDDWSSIDHNVFIHDNSASKFSIKHKSIEKLNIDEVLNTNNIFHSKKKNFQKLIDLITHDMNINNNIINNKKYDVILRMDDTTATNKDILNFYNISELGNTRLLTLDYDNASYNSTEDIFYNGLNESFSFEDVPEEMKFNTSHVITICSYGVLFILSAIGNISVLRSLAK